MGWEIIWVEIVIEAFKGGQKRLSISDISSMCVCLLRGTGNLQTAHKRVPTLYALSGGSDVTLSTVSDCLTS